MENNYKVRLLNELIELSEKIALLSNYIDSNIIEESDILYEQLHIMLDYRSILRTRIEKLF